MRDLNRLDIIVGIAGAGKTTFLANLLTNRIRLFNFEFSPENTVCLSFSRMAKYVLSERLQYKYQVNTFHSYISKILASQGKLKIVSNHKLNAFFTDRGFNQLPYVNGNNTDYYIADHIYSDLNKYRLLDISPEEYYEQDSIEKSTDFYSLSKSEWLKLVKDFQAFIKENGSDYTDILTQGLNLAVNIPILVVDEANDLSPLMWKLIETWNIDRVILVGDPNQNIYEFGGSTPKYLLLKKPVYELTKSHRVPDNILEYAGRYIVYPFSKPLKGNGTKGNIEYGFVEEFIDFLSQVNKYDPSATAYMLSYKRKTAREFSILLKEEGIPHLLFNDPLYPIMSVRLYYLYHDPDQLSVHDLKQLIQHSRLKNKTKILQIFPKNEAYAKSIKANDVFSFRQYLKTLQAQPIDFFNINEDTVAWYERIKANPDWLFPKINVSTIHQVKGGEADHVYVHFDVNSSLDTEYRKRLYYVATTRARKNLMINPDLEEMP
ncbi:MAG: AAA family ATPase [Archaeoglobaceae archaeon]